MANLQLIPALYDEVPHAFQELVVVLCAEKVNADKRRGFHNSNNTQRSSGFSHLLIPPITNIVIQTLWDKTNKTNPKWNIFETQGQWCCCESLPACVIFLGSVSSNEEERVTLTSFLTGLSSPSALSFTRALLPADKHLYGLEGVRGHDPGCHSEDDFVRENRRLRESLSKHERLLSSVSCTLFTSSDLTWEKSKRYIYKPKLFFQWIQLTKCTSCNVVLENESSLLTLDTGPLTGNILITSSTCKLCWKQDVVESTG